MNLKLVGNLSNDVDLVAAMNINGNTYPISTTRNPSEKEEEAPLEDVTKGEPKIVQSLLKEGMGTNIRDDSAAEFKHTGILQLLLGEEDNNINAQNKKGNSTLAQVLVKNNLEIGGVLIRAEAIPESTMETITEISAEICTKVPE